MPKEAEGKTGKPTGSRNKPQRPRDELGRPLSWGARNLLVLEDFDSLDAGANHRLGIEHFDAGRFFHAHEAWETAWKLSRDTGDAEFFKGLAQLGAGYTHLLRGNAHGAVTLLERARGRIQRYPKRHRGLDTREVALRAAVDISRIEAGELQPGPDALAEDGPRIGSY